MNDEFGDKIISLGCLSLPEGWRVVQLESGHYMGTNGMHDTPITVNRFHARKWAFEIEETS